MLWMYSDYDIVSLTGGKNYEPLINQQYDISSEKCKEVE